MECVYKSKDGVCLKLSTDMFTDYCVEGLCPHEMLSDGDLISRSALLAEFGEEPLSWNDEDWEVQERMDWRKYTADVRNAPAVDAVEVVRCKDCKHWKKGDFQAGDDVSNLEYGGRCPIARFARYESDFCSRGERRDGE